MEKLSNSIEIFEDDLEYAFISFLEKNGYDPNTSERAKIPNSVFYGAFLHVFKTVIKPRHEQASIVNNTDIHLRSMYAPEDIVKLTKFYIEKVYIYNIVSFVDMYCTYLGISPETYYNWLDGNKELSINYMDCAQKVRSLGKQQVRNKLSDDRTGVVVLANNDLEIGLEYNNKRALENESAKQLLQIDQLPNFRIPEKTENP